MDRMGWLSGDIGVLGSELQHLRVPPSSTPVANYLLYSLPPGPPVSQGSLPHPLGAP